MEEFYDERRATWKGPHFDHSKGAERRFAKALRTQGADATMSLEVLRFDTGEVLEGQINGDPLAQSFSFAQEFEDDVSGADGGTGSLDTYTDYTTVEC